MGQHEFQVHGRPVRESADAPVLHWLQGTQLHDLWAQGPDQRLQDRR